MNRTRCFATASTLALAASAWAQPEMLSLGDGVTAICVTNDGAIYGSVGGVATRFVASGGVVSATAIPGATSVVNCTPDGQFLIADVVNAGGLGGFPTNATLAARWSQSTGWVPIPFITADPTLGVPVNTANPTASGSSNSSGSVHSVRAISANGRFVVGQGYVTTPTTANNTFRFRGWVCDTEANGGAGQTILLPTSLNTTVTPNRYFDGRALGVSNDGTMIVGGEDPGSSNGRIVYWRKDTGTGQYVMSYLPDGVNSDTGQPIRHTVGNGEYHMNSDGSIIVGMSYDFSAETHTNTGPFLTRWNWNSETSTYSRTLLGSALDHLPAWRVPSVDCPIPPTFIVGGMTDDCSTITGIAVYSTCGSFLRGGFIWTPESGLMIDMWEHLSGIGTVGVESWSSPGTNLPPRLGYSTDVSPNGRYMTGFGSPAFSSPGPSWLLDMEGELDCTPAFMTINPVATFNLSRCTSFILNAGGGGTAPVSYQWTRNDQPLVDGTENSGALVAGALTNRLVITRPTLEEVGTYACIVSAGCGAPISSTTTVVQVDPALTPVVNDICDTATEVGEGTYTFSPCAAFQDDIVGAGCTIGFPTADVWYKYTPTFTGDVRMETCGANYDTVLSIFDHCLGFEVACNDDRPLSPGNVANCSSLRSRIAAYHVDQDVPVWVRVASVGFLSGTSTGSVSIFRAPAVPVNDLCDGALPATAGPNIFNSDECGLDGVASCNASSGRDIWFTYRAPSQGTLTVDTCGSLFNTVLSVYSSCGGPELGCNDNANTTGCTQQSRVSNIAMTCGQTVLIRVAGNSATVSGNGTLNVTFTNTGPACACDWNGVDGLDSQDFFDFLEAFFNANADFNCADGTDSQDYFDFLECFFTGCN